MGNELYHKESLQTYQNLHIKKATGPDKILVVVLKNIDQDLFPALENNYSTVAWKSYASKSMEDINRLPSF